VPLGWTCGWRNAPPGWLGVEPLVSSEAGDQKREGVTHLGD
jgi:hypothetical protein